MYNNDLEYRLSFIKIGDCLSLLVKSLVGSFKQLKAFSLSPLLAPIYIPLVMLFPMALPLIVNYSAKSKSKSNLALYLNWRLVLIWFLWIFFLFIGFTILVDVISTMSAAYSKELAEGKLYSSALSYTVNTIKDVYFFIACCVLTLALVFSLTQATILYPFEGIVLGIQAFIRNLPGVLIYLVFFSLVSFFIERQFAYFKLEALQNYMLGKDFFDPSFLFIVLRLYLVQILLSSLVMLFATAFGVVDLKSQIK